jgi:hypothetical protein
MAWRPIVQPTLVARWPQPLREQLRAYGIAPRTLSIDELDALLQRPPTNGALLIDLRGNTLAEVARLLGVIQATQRRSDAVPLLVVPREALGMQRLIASAERVRAVVLNPDQPDTLAAWLIAPTTLIPATIWVNVPRPALRHQHSQLSPLVAQLACAESLDQVARRAAITPRSIYAILHTWCGHIPGRRLPAERWYALLSIALCGQSLDLETQQSTRRCPPAIDLRSLRRDLVCKLQRKNGSWPSLVNLNRSGVSGAGEVGSRRGQTSPASPSSAC